MEWIKCSERMPELECKRIAPCRAEMVSLPCWVLWAYGDKKPELCYYEAIGKNLGNTYGGLLEVEMRFRGESEHRKVKCWMPYYTPEPPKE